MTNQVKAAIRQMKAAGFDRDEFKVEVEKFRRRDRETGRRFTEYGDAQVVCCAARDKIESKIRDLVNVGLGVHVVIFEIDGEVRRGYPHISARYEDTGRYIVRDLTADPTTDPDRYWGRTEIYANVDDSKFWD